MPLNFSTDDGAEVEITSGSDVPAEVQAAKEAFSRAQANDPVSDDARRPPKRPDKTDPGYTPNPEPKRRGRPRKGDPDASRMTKTTREKVKKEPLKPKDYRPALTAVTDMAWFAGSVTPVVSNYTAPYAAIIKANQQGIVEGLNLAANNSHTARKVVEKIVGDGEGTGGLWMLPLVPVIQNITGQVIAVAKDKEFRDNLIEQNKIALQQYAENMLAMAQEIQGQTAGS